MEGAAEIVGDTLSSLLELLELLELFELLSLLLDLLLEEDLDEDELFPPFPLFCVEIGAMVGGMVGGRTLRLSKILSLFRRRTRLFTPLLFFLFLRFLPNSRSIVSWNACWLAV